MAAQSEVMVTHFTGRITNGNLRDVPTRSQPAAWSPGPTTELCAPTTTAPLLDAGWAANHQKHELSHQRSREVATGRGELFGAMVTMMFHIHHWSAWSPAYQPSLSLAWRRRRKCRTCGKEQVEVI
jgi:hypothetical protein